MMFFNVCGIVFADVYAIPQHILSHNINQTTCTIGIILKQAGDNV